MTRQTLERLQLCFGVATSVLFTATVFSQSVEGDRKETPRESDFTVSERGAHHRVWERIEYETRPDGRKIPHVRSYNELSTGMHFKDPATGQWRESKAEIQILPDGAGAKADQGQHKVIFPANINDGLIELNTPDDKWLRSRVLGLSYYDTSTGESVMIAEVKDSVGELHPPNAAIYPDAFTDIKADIRYTYTLAGFEQDVILREQLASPRDYGLTPETTRLEVLTEFLNPPAPVKETREFRGVVDEHLNFGVMKIGRGRAFALGEENNKQRSQPVVKVWEKLEGRDCLIEQVEFESVKGELDKLPRRTAMNDAPKASPTGEKRSAKGRALPAVRTAHAQNTNAFLTASADIATRPGYVLDWVIINGDQTNHTFKGDSTYYVSGATFLKSTAIIEGGTVIKYGTNASASIYLHGELSCLTGPYRPAIFTSANDDSVGEVISGSTGSPFTAGDVTYIIDESGIDEFRHLRFAYAGIALVSVAFEPHFWDCQFISCGMALWFWTQARPFLHNVLAANCDAVVYCQSAEDGITVAGEQVTVDSCGDLITTQWGYGVDWYAMTNSILSDTPLPASTSNPGYTFFVSSTILTNDGSVFQPVGAAKYYLNTNSPYRDAGTTNITASLLADLRRKTTYPPIVYSNATISVPTTFTPQAQRDTDVPDLGYHYDPLDYVFGGSDVNTNITFAAGTAVGWFRTSSGWNHAGHGIHVGDRQTATFAGTAEAPCYWVRANTVQERGGNTIWQGGYGPGGMTSWADHYGSITNAGQVNARFLKCSSLSGDSGNHFRDDWGILIGRFQDSEFYNSGIQGYNSSFYFTNCLFHRAGVGGMNEGRPGNALVVRNSTWYGGYIYLTPTYAIPSISIRDCALDATTVTATGYAANSSYANYDYNGYTNASSPFPFGSSQKSSVAFNWQTGALGGFYLPTNSVLINAGSANANLLGLYHYTTQTNQVSEGASTVDIGYHYVATTANGQPLDLDEDSIPDYLDDDADGDGLPDLWEILYFGMLDGKGDDDSDSDGLTDLEEYQHQTDPTNPDTDGDYLSDGNEVHAYGTNPLNTDTDSDGRTDWQELYDGTNPKSSASKATWAVVADIPYNFGQQQQGLSPTLQVWSENGVWYFGISAGEPDIFYDLRGSEQITGPWIWLGRMKKGARYELINPDYSGYYYSVSFPDDSDGDGLSDAYEVNATNTDPNNPDSDGDGMSDGWEIEYGFDALSNENGSDDVDGDGLTNLEEFKLGKDPTTPNVTDLWFEPVGGNHNSPLLVKVTCSTPDATIYYTTDGSEPDLSSGSVNSGDEVLLEWEIQTLPTLTITGFSGADITLKAKAWKSGWIASDTEAQGYRFSGGNQPPVITVLPSGGSFAASDTIEILVEADDTDGMLQAVQLYRDDYKIAESSSSPLRYSIESIKSDTYEFTAKAIDDAGAVTLSSPITITVAASGPVVSLVGTQPFFTSSPGTLAATVVGVDPGGLTSLTLNSTAITPRTGGFTLNAPLTEGENTFTLSATDNESNTAEATTKVYLDSVAPVVAITAPANSSTFATERINVSGTFTETSLKRITVNGVLAFIGSGTFEALNVPLAEGANTITAVAEDIAGNETSASISVTGGSSPVDPVQLGASPVGGFVSLQVTFTPAASVPGTLQYVYYDFDGNGTADQTETDLDPINHSYTTAGEYFPVVTIQTTAGRFSSLGGWNSTTTDRLRINVQAAPQQVGSAISIPDPVDLKTTADGHLFILSRSGATIYEYNASHTLIRSKSSIGSTPTGLDVDADGNVYVALSGDDQVAKFNPDGNTFTLDESFGSSGLIGSSGDGDGEFDAPFDVAISPDGTEIAVSDSGNHRIQRFSTSDGSFIGTFGQSGSAIGQFNTPKGLTFDGSGYLYIVDSGNNRVVLTLSSAVIGTSGSSGAVNLCVGPRGIYIAETSNDRIQVFDPVRDGHGASPTPFGVRLALSGQFSPALSQPSAIAPIADFLEEKIYIADTGNNRVIKVALPESSTPGDAWAAMKTKLVSNSDIDGAVAHFATASAENYQEAFYSIGASKLTSIMGQIPALTPVAIDGNSAQYFFEEEIEDVTITFPVEFIKENGIWKIMEY